LKNTHLGRPDEILLRMAPSTTFDDVEISMKVPPVAVLLLLRIVPSTTFDDVETSTKVPLVAVLLLLRIVPSTTFDDVETSMKVPLVAVLLVIVKMVVTATPPLVEALSVIGRGSDGSIFPGFVNKVG
jgi:hypothetical protein